MIPEIQPEDLKRKEMLFKPIPEGQTYTTCLVRRRKSKSGKHRFYIYDSQDQLQIAAECDIYNDCYFTISLDAIEFNDSSPFTIGKLTHRRYDTYYYGEILQNNAFHKNMTIKYLSSNAKKGRGRKMEISFEPGFGPEERLVQSDTFNETFKTLFPDLSEKMQKSSKNFFIFSEKGRHCFSLAKIYKDEFHLAISNPLSIFDGFLIALSTFHILKNE